MIKALLKRIIIYILILILFLLFNPLIVSNTDPAKEQYEFSISNIKREVENDYVF